MLSVIDNRKDISGEEIRCLQALIMLMDRQRILIFFPNPRYGLVIEVGEQLSNNLAVLARRILSFCTARMNFIWNPHGTSSIEV